MDLKDELKQAGLPKHIAVIMDGNGRWAKERGLERIYGHRQGVEAVRRTVEAAGEIGLEYLTLYTFSLENWNRPRAEVDGLMELMASAIVKEKDELMRLGVRIRVIGNTGDLPEGVWHLLHDLVKDTEANTRLNLTLALSYGSRWEILEAARKMAADVKAGRVAGPEAVTEADFSSYLATAGMPDPDLLVRTSGEYRLSNFLLWQCAYTEFYFIDKFWPDFEKEDLYLAIRSFQSRERRFGMTGDQVNR